MKKILSLILTISLLTFYTYPTIQAVETSPSPAPTAESSAENDGQSNRKKTSTPTASPTEDTKKDTTDDSPEKEEKDNEKKSTEEDKKEEKEDKDDKTDTKKDRDKKDEDKKDTEEEEKDDTPAKSPTVLSKSAILVNSDTGKILYEKDAHTKRYPASTTKIMTAYLVLSRLSLDTLVTASKNAVTIPNDSSKMGLVEGETLTVKDLLYAMLVQSANDAANALAEAAAGSIPDFVALMNQTAQELGMSNTHFSNPHGYHVSDHYTTAYDMSIIAQKAMENETFREIVSAKTYTIAPTNKTETERVYRTRNMLISNISTLELRYSYATGIKTGYTDNAGQCLVAGANKNGFNLISVTFFAPENNTDRAYLDTKSMFEYAYSNYSMKTILKADELASTCDVKWASGKSHLTLKTNQDVKTLLPKENYNETLLTSVISLRDDITAPIKNGEEIGKITYFYDGAEVATANLYATRDISRSYVKQVLSYLLSPVFLIGLGLLVAFLLLQRRKMKRRAARIRKAQKMRTKR